MLVLLKLETLQGALRLVRAAGTTYRVETREVGKKQFKLWESYSKATDAYETFRVLAREEINDVLSKEKPA